MTDDNLLRRYIMGLTNTRIEILQENCDEWKRLFLAEKKKRCELREAATVVVEHAAKILADSPLVCCWQGCPYQGKEVMMCCHEKHPSGYVGLGSHLWVEIKALGQALRARLEEE